MTITINIPTDIGALEFICTPGDNNLLKRIDFVTDGDTGSIVRIDPEGVGPYEVAVNHVETGLGGDIGRVDDGALLDCIYNRLGGELSMVTLVDHSRLSDSTTS